MSDAGKKKPKRPKYVYVNAYLVTRRAPRPGPGAKVQNHWAALGSMQTPNQQINRRATAFLLEQRYKSHERGEGKIYKDPNAAQLHVVVEHEPARSHWIGAVGEEDEVDERPISSGGVPFIGPAAYVAPVLKDENIPAASARRPKRKYTRRVPPAPITMRAPVAEPAPEIIAAIQPKLVKYKRKNKA